MTPSTITIISVVVALLLAVVGFIYKMRLDTQLKIVEANLKKATANAEKLAIAKRDAVAVEDIKRIDAEIKEQAQQLVALEAEYKTKKAEIEARKKKISEAKTWEDLDKS